MIHSDASNDLKTFQHLLQSSWILYERALGSLLTGSTFGELEY